MQIIKLFLLISSGLAFLLSWTNINHLPPWNGFYSEAFAVVSLFLILIIYVIEGFQIKIKSLGITFIAIFCLHALFQYTSKRIFFFSTSALYAYYLAFIAITFQLGQFIQKKGDQQLVAYAIFATSLVSAFLALADWLGIGNEGVLKWLIDSQQLSFRAQGNIMHPNHLGTLCMMGLATTVIIWQHKNWHWITAIPATVLISCVAGLTASRTTLLSMTLIIFATYFLSKREDRNRSLTIMATAFFALASTLIFSRSFYELILLGAPHEVSMSVIDRGATSAGRTALWAQAIAAIKLQPWFGFGWRQIAASQILVAHEYPGIYATIYYHNFFLDFIVENGIIFSIIYTILLLIWIRQHKLSKHKEYLLIALTLITPSLTEYQFSYTYILLPVVLCMSFAIEPRILITEDNTRKDLNTIYQGLFYLIFVFFSCLVFLDYINCEKIFVSSRLKANGIISTTNDQEHQKAFVLDDLYLLSNVFYFNKEVYSRDDLQKLQYLSARFPYILVKLYYIKALVQFHELERAKEIYRGVMNCYSDNAKEYLNSMIDNSPSLHPIREI